MMPPCCVFCDTAIEEGRGNVIRAVVLVALCLSAGGCRAPAPRPPPKREPAAFGVPALYAPLFELGRSWRYRFSYDYTPQWNEVPDAAEAEVPGGAYGEEMAPDGEQPCLRRPQQESVEAPAACRVRQVRRLGQTRLARVRCNLIRKVVLQRCSDSRYTTTDPDLGSATYLFNARGLWVGDEVCDKRCRERLLSGPPLLPPRPAPLRRGDLAGAEQRQTTVERRTIKLGSSAVSAWCHTVLERVGVEGSETTTRCFAPGRGLVLHESSIHNRAMESDYELVERALELVLSGPAP
jgi:hypothetical protein